jgi:lipopolysaccharide biosynthesis glycosyltransferase
MPPELRGKAAATLSGLVARTGSSIEFLAANDDFYGAKTGSWSTATLYRLMLVKLLPKLDRIIYADCDVCFCRGLAEADETDLGHNLAAGVPYGAKDYLNGGFLILNLKEIRKAGLYEKWIEMLKAEQYSFLDQDVLNLTCAGRKLMLPLKFNFVPYEYRKSNKHKLHSSREFGELVKTVMLHFTAGQKPWCNRQSIYAPLWWKYARESGLFQLSQ